MKLNAKEFKEKFLSLPDNQKADVFARANFARKMYEKLEKLIKDYIKKTVTEFEENKGSFEGIPVSRVYTRRFNVSEFEENATKKEKQIYEEWKEIEEKYKTSTESIRI